MCFLVHAMGFADSSSTAEIDAQSASFYLRDEIEKGFRIAAILVMHCDIPGHLNDCAIIT
jgi:hypothetical protein